MSLLLQFPFLPSIIHPLHSNQSGGVFFKFLLVLVWFPITFGINLNYTAIPVLAPAYLSGLLFYGSPFHASSLARRADCRAPT